LTVVPAMTDLVHPQDVLLYIKSEDVIRLVLPPDAHDEALGALRTGGYYTFQGAPYSSQAGVSATTFPASQYGNQAITEKTIPESEDDAIRRAGRAVLAHGRRMHVVDVGKESAPRRIISEHLHHLKKFPVLCRPDGRRLEGADEFTDENLEKILRD
jgi:hypothetical protein